MRSDRLYEVIDGQTDFLGGMRQVGKLRDNEYRLGRNIIIRNGPAETRPGMKLAFNITNDGYREGFWFNQDAARYSDATHTGFWFPFSFVSWFFGTVQGVTFFRFVGESYSRQLVVGGGKVYVHDRGYVTEIPTGEDLSSTETVRFTIGNNKLVMFRSGGNAPLYWDGADQDTGFQTFTDPGTTNRIPKGDRGVYMYGRLWVVDNQDDMYASDVLDFDTYDYVDQLFSSGKGDGDSIQAIVPFHETYAIVFKKRRVDLLKNVNVAVPSGSTLADFVEIENLDQNIGMVGDKAFAVHGEQVSFLSYKGITSVSRTAEGRILGKEVSLSAPIQQLVDRINFEESAAIETACATFYDNYLLFGVPTDGSSTNNKVYVFDLIANNGQGAWVGYWDGALMNPAQFFVEEEKLYFISTDGHFREMWTNDFVDSYDPYDDTQIFDPTATYKVDEYVYNAIATDQKIYKSLQDSNNDNDLSDTDWWEEVTDIGTLYNIILQVTTRYYEHGDEVSPKRYSRCEMAFDHKDPEIDLDIEDEDFNTVQNIFTDQGYSQLIYDIANTANWDPSNVNLDHDNPHREDYTLYVPTAGLYVHETDGIYADVHETHALRFIPRVVNNRRFSVLVTNEKGWLAVRTIICKAQQGRFAMRKR